MATENEPKYGENDLGIEPRDLTVAQRRSLFRKAKAKRKASELIGQEADVTIWHPIDNPMSPDQMEDLPGPLLGKSRTSALWVKFPHPNSRQLLVSRGHFDYNGFSWTARLTPKDQFNLIGRVQPIAWTPVIKGQEPTGVPIIPRYANE